MSSKIDRLFAELIQLMEAEPALDPEAFVRGHPEEADELRARLERLRRVGLLDPAGADSIDPRSADFHPRLPARYRILEEVGRGGMGSVYRAHDAQAQREVAIKIVKLASPSATSTMTHARLHGLLAEARVTGGLQHPGIVPVHDMGTLGEAGAYFTMRLVVGRTLAAICHSLAAGNEETQKQFPIARCVEIVSSICDALAFAHSKGVLHRDLKPSNVMVGSFGEVQVLDWGLAGFSEHREVAGTAQQGPRSAGYTTARGEVFGTPSFMAPEQGLGREGDLDERTDVFGAGAILYQLLSGNPPYWGTSLNEVLERARAGELNDPDFSKSRLRVPRELSAVCRKALAPAKQDRYDSVAQLSDDLRAYLRFEPGRAWRDGPFALATKGLRKHPGKGVAVFSAAVVLALLLSLHERGARNELLREQALYRRILDEVPELSTASQEFEVASRMMAYDDWCRRFLQSYREFGFALTGEAPVGELIATYRRIQERDPRTAEALLDGLLEFSRIYSQAGGIDAWLALEGREIRRKSGVTDQDWEQRMALVERLIREDPAFAGIWPRLNELMEALLVDHEQTAAIWRGLRAWWLEKDDVFDSIRLETGALRPGDLALMARFAQFTRGMAAALPILEQAVQLDPSDFWAHFLYGNAMNGTPGLPNRRQLACAQFEAAIALNPRSSWAYTNLGYSLVEVAIQHLSRAEQLEGQAAEVERAQAEQARARAAAAYERAIELNPRISAALASLANLIRSEDPARAEELYESALAAEPCMWTSLQSYATFLEESGRFEECLVQLQAMMDCDPKRSESHWEVALATSRFGERLSWSDHPRSGEVLEAAASHWRTYLELKPGSEQALVYLQVVDGLLEQVRSQ